MIINHIHVAASQQYEVRKIQNYKETNNLTFSVSVRRTMEGNLRRREIRDVSRVKGSFEFKGIGN